MPAEAGRDDRPVVVFGNSRFTSLAAYCMSNDSPDRVAGFTVDAAYLDGPQFDGLPLVAFEEVVDRFPPGRYRMLVPLGYLRANGLRRARFEAALQLGYDFASYISSRASTWPDLRVGRNALVFEHAIIQPFASIGDNCIIRSGAHISHHCRIADHCFVAAEVAMGGGCTVGEQAFIGVGAVLRDNLGIAERSFIGAGAVVVGDTEADCVYVGNPARKTGKSALEVTGG